MLINAEALIIIHHHFSNDSKKLPRSQTEFDQIIPGAPGNDDSKFRDDAPMLNFFHSRGLEANYTQRERERERLLNS